MNLISTVIRIHHHVIPADLRDADADIIAAKIAVRMREFGVDTQVSDVISHMKTELQTAHLANASAELMVMRPITPLPLGAMGQTYVHARADRRSNWPRGMGAYLSPL